MNTIKKKRNETEEHFNRKKEFAKLLNDLGYITIIEPDRYQTWRLTNDHGLKIPNCYGRDRVNRIPDILAIKKDFLKPIWIEIQIKTEKKFPERDWTKINKYFFYYEARCKKIELDLHLFTKKIEEKQERINNAKGVISRNLD